MGDPIGDKKLALNRRGSSDEVALLVAGGGGLTDHHLPPLRTWLLFLSRPRQVVVWVVNQQFIGLIAQWLVCTFLTEFRLLDEQLSALSTAAESAAEASGGRAEPSVLVAASGSSSDVDVELAERGVAYIDDAELARLAVEIPDLRVRLGIPETQVGKGLWPLWIVE